LCCFVAILSVRWNALLLPRLNLSSRAKVETTEKLGEAIRAKNTEYSARSDLDSCYSFPKQKEVRAFFFWTLTSHERESKEETTTTSIWKLSGGVESQNATRKKERFLSCMHKKKQKSSSTQRPHHHRVVVPVVLIIKLSCYHQRKSWFISLTSRYNFFIKLIIY
jgi:hypothetical protein